MTKVEFDEDKSFLYSRIEISDRTPFVVSYLMKIGLVKNEKQARYILIAGVLLMIFLSLFIFLSSEEKKFKSDELPEGYLNEIAY